jgi:succinate dehydrogenase flavin-adding protein (antitoxin of CptAB toxin-antitoxin module)
MKHIISILIIVFSINTFGQTNELKSSDIFSFAYSFKIENNQLVGSGADSLKKAIRESQFFMLGEEHFSPQISELTNIILPYFSSYGYDNFALEVGPYTAEIIQREIKLKNTLFDFNSSFNLKYKDVPIPFFDGTKDDDFIKTALKYNFKLWGLDQEYITAPLFLLDEIYRNSKDSISSKKQYRDAKDYLEQQLNKFNSEKKNQYFEMFDSDNDLTKYLNQCNEPKQQEIIEALKISMDIYKQQNWNGNQARMEYMKRNFSNNYQAAQKNDSFPKVLIKMGSMHLGWGKSWLGIYDLGNMINELSYFNNTKSVSVNCFSRYIEDENGTIYDYMSDREGANLSLILELASKDSWTLIDNKKIIELARNRKIKLNNDLIFLLSRYNYILFAPLKTIVENNY